MRFQPRPPGRAHVSTPPCNLAEPKDQKTKTIEGSILLRGIFFVFAILESVIRNLRDSGEHRLSQFVSDSFRDRVAAEEEAESKIRVQACGIGFCTRSRHTGELIA